MVGGCQRNALGLNERHHEDKRTHGMADDHIASHVQIIRSIEPERNQPEDEDEYSSRPARHCHFQLAISGTHLPLETHSSQIQLRGLFGCPIPRPLALVAQPER
jgi:hypothetical protein